MKPMFVLRPMKDAYQAHRGGYSVFLNCACAKCNTDLFYYQKDGPGPLLRCYWNRIRLNLSAVIVEDLRCSSCDVVVGVLTTYKDGRPAFEILEDALDLTELGETVAVSIVPSISESAREPLANREKSDA